MDVFKSPVSADLEKMKAEGFFLRSITGDEHPETLLQQCLHGPWVSCGKPHAIVHGGKVLAIINGDERNLPFGEADRLYPAINAVRESQGRPPKAPNVY